MNSRRMPLIARLLVLGCTKLMLQVTFAAEPARPNILVILADDLGYADLGVQGCEDIPTPNIDLLANNGVRFTSGYVSCPVCSPTRAGLMTGRYQQRFGHEFNPGPALTAEADFGLSLKEIPLPKRLKDLGYATGMFGKWHLGYQPQFHPLNRGFDEFLGFLGGSHSYVDNRDGANPVQRGTKPVDEVTYTTEMFAAAAADFVTRHKDEPFFVYLPFNAVHTPLQATHKYRNRFESIQDPKRRTFAGMLSAMDDGVGQVLGKLRDLKLEENTLIFFFSDNGGPTRQTTSRNDPLRGFKGQVLEGGIRIPFIVQWTGHIPAGRVDDRPVIQLDIYPTAVAAAGGKISPDWKLDGVNLLPYLTEGKSGSPHEDLFWRFGEQYALRQGDWKLVVTRGSPQPELYNLTSDIGEDNDLAAKEPERLKSLQKAFEEWNAQLAEPKWKRGQRAAKAAKRKARN